MKKAIFIFLALAFASCEAEDEYVYQVDSEFTTYVDGFFADAAARGITIEKKNLIVTRGNAQSAVDFSATGQRQIKYSNRINFPGPITEGNLYHNLAHVLLGKGPSTDPDAIMNPDNQYKPIGANREELIDELFEN